VNNFHFPINTSFDFVTAGRNGQAKTPRREEPRVRPSARRGDDQQIRETQSISQRQLARSAGIAPQGLSKLERGQVVPSITTLDAVARELHIDTFDLIGAGFSSSKSVPPPAEPKSVVEAKSLLMEMTERQRALSLELLKAVVKSN